MKSIQSFAIAALLVLSSSVTSQAQTSADVIVYGSTPGGFCAAIAAAREGASVILLEPTQHVGGMNTGGLSFSDSNQMYRDKLIGLFHEWHLRIQQDYQGRGITLPYDVNVKNQATWSYEPSVASRVTNAMLSEAGVSVLTGRYLQSVTMTGPRITGIVTSNGTYTARVFVDGSYEGDLMAAAGVSWTIGREGTADFGESYAGKRYPKSNMNIDGFDGTGNPLPLITGTAAGPTATGDDNIMTYSFRLSLTNNAANKVPMPAPANYDPARFEVMRRYVQAGGGSQIGFDRYDVPGNKKDGNNAIGLQFSLGLVGGGKGWATADEAGRAAIFEAHKQYTLEFIHFLSTDPVFSESARASIAQWGLCADEFTASGNWPPQLYVRESRRMQGMYVIKQSDILTDIVKPDPIMVSSFPIDSHDCQRIASPGGGVRNEGTILPVRQMPAKIGYPYHVPYRAILPQPAECDNLLVPVALSCTHVAISSLRIEGTWMAIGQSAGIAAALAAAQDVAVQNLPYADLKTRLLAQGQALTLPQAFQPLEGIVLDDPDAVLTGTWSPSSSITPFQGTGYRYTGSAAAPNDGSATATFRFTAPEAGIYRFNIAYTEDPTRATNVPVTVTSGPHVTNFTVNQTVARPVGSVMREIGTVSLVADQESVITIGTAGTTGFVILDAVQLVLDVSGPDETPPVPTDMLPMGGNAATTAALVINFNETVQAGSGNIRLFLADGTPVQTIAVTDGAVSISGSGVTIQINALAPGTGYYVNLDAGAITDLAGNPYAGIGDTSTWAFTTDSAPPLATGMLPMGGGAETTAALVINFNETVQAGSGNIRLFLTDGTPVQTIAVTDGAVSISGSGVTIQITALAAATGYYVNLDAGAITDLSGNPYAGIGDTSTWAFTTASTPPPVATGMLPMGGNAATTAALVINFNKTVQAGSGNIRLFLADGTPVQTIAVTNGAVSISGSGVTIQITALAAGTGYYVNLDAGAITDLAGTPYAGIGDTSTWAFTTASTPPTVGGTIYSETFSNGSVGTPTDLNGSTPDVTTGGNTWSASEWQENGTTATIATGPSTGLDHSAFLPFTPTAGNIYTLSATMSVPTGGATTGWVGLGFAATNTTTGSFFSNNTAPWILYRPGVGNVDSFLGPATGGTADEGNWATSATFSIVLNTEVAAWTAEWFIDDGSGPVSVRSETFGTNPTIGHVGFGRENGNNTAIDNFSLTVNTPGGGNNFTDWIVGKPGVGVQTGLNDDPDGDGIANGVENFFGTEPGVFSQGLVSGTVDTGTNTFTFTHPLNATPAADLTATYRWSKDLATFFPEGPGDGTTVTFSTSTDAGVTTVTATATGSIPDKFFVRVHVTQN